MTSDAQHTEPHMDDELDCLCECDRCSRTVDVGTDGERAVCICAECDPDKCGLHEPSAS